MKSEKGTHNNCNTLDVLGLILGGGRGTRLYPLTKERAKPAVPLLGQYRLIDIPISNCLNSGINKIYVLTQFNSESLLRHVANTYNFDIFSESWVEILPAQQTLTDANWYQGTADAVRQNLHFVETQKCPYTLILGGDQLCHIDFESLFRQHRRRSADITVCCTPVSREEATSLGVAKVKDDAKIIDFVEKPSAEDIDDKYDFPSSLLSERDSDFSQKPVLASMGIYLFNTDLLIDILQTHKDCNDFGGDVLPLCLKSFDLYAHLYCGYWTDIGTIDNFYEANLAMAGSDPAFNLFDPDTPIYTHPRFLPPPRLEDCHVRQSLIGAGSRIDASEIENSIVGLRSRIGKGSKINRAILMGADYYETRTRRDRANSKGVPLGIGEECLIQNCIIDKNARIGDGVRILPATDRQNMDTDIFSIRNGIVVIPKNTTIPSHATLP
jgi:glucose-1-phosphate adenylyltransferase